MDLCSEREMNENIQYGVIFRPSKNSVWDNFIVLTQKACSDKPTHRRAVMPEYTITFCMSAKFKWKWKRSDLGVILSLTGQLALLYLWGLQETNTVLVVTPGEQVHEDVRESSFQSHQVFKPHATWQHNLKRTSKK